MRAKRESETSLTAFFRRSTIVKSMTAPALAAKVTQSASRPPMKVATTMQAADTMVGTRETREPDRDRAFASSHMAATMPTRTMKRKEIGRKIRDASTTPPMSSPMPIAAGRLRPARP